MKIKFMISNQTLIMRKEEKLELKQNKWQSQIAFGSNFT